MPSKMLALRLELVSDPPLLSWLVLHGEFLYLGTYVDLLTFESKLDWIGLDCKYLYDDMLDMSFVL